MKKIFVSILIFIFGIPAEGAIPKDAILVNQPAYHSMNFYVYKPANIPNEFFATYDGYLVYKNEKEIWHYASAENNGIIKTDFVVGAVIPSVVKLKPYNAKISSVAPVLGSPELYTNTTQIQKTEFPKILEPVSRRIVYTPPSSASELYRPVIFSPNATDWTQNSNFMAIGKWQKSIDKIGVLDRPEIPVAWKGDYPEVVYAWTGLQWRQMSARGKNISALSTIRRGIYGLTVHTKKLNILSWSDDDSHVLSQYAMMWGYQWLGKIIIGREY